LKVNFSFLDSETQGKGETIMKKITMGDLVKKKKLGLWHAYWLAEQIMWYKNIGLEEIKIREHTKEELCKFILKSKKLSMGKKCEEFEDKFSKYQGRKYSVFYNSGSSANLALIQSLLNLGSLKKGDNIGISSLTWATNIMPIIELGLKPVLIDISKDNLNVTSKTLLDIKENITPKDRAIVEEIDISDSSKKFFV